jgi:methyl-accepting chemotaxis protein
MSLKNRIVAVIALLAIVVVSMGFISSYLKMTKSESRYNELAINGNQQLWNLITLKQYTLMGSGIKSITRDRKLKKALVKNDLAVVKENAKTAFNLLEGQKLLNSLQIIDASGKIVFDVQNPSAQNKINTLAKMVIKKKKILTSINLNHQGKLQTELVFPITNRGKVIGAGSYSLSINVAIKQLKERQGSQVYVSTIRGDLLSSSEINIDEELANLDLPLKEAKHLAISKNSNVFSTTILPIEDISKQLLANIIILSDDTISYKSQQKINVSAGILLLLISLIMLVFIYWYLNNALKPLHAISQSLQSVSEGDLTVSIDQNERQDEISEIQRAICNTIKKLHELISQVSPLVIKVNTSSDLLNQAVEKNQSNIDQQKNNISQVNLAASGVGSAVASISQFSDEMSKNSQDADEELKKGSTIIHQTIGSVNNIASQVDEASAVINNLFTETETIGSVLDVIKGIAEQTNLLALNAAIEAARAGEAGRGFAVVADEVRTLAGKTQESTVEIEQMIERLRTGASDAVSEMKNSQEEVTECVDLANKTELSLGIITPQVGEIKDKSIEINQSIDEQKSAIEDINQNISTIEQVAENSVEKNAEALEISHSLKELSTNLENLISQFKV